MEKEQDCIFVQVAVGCGEWGEKQVGPRKERKRDEGEIGERERDEKTE